MYPLADTVTPVICDEDNLRRVSDALQGVIITHQDYKNVLETAKSGDFIYFDPTLLSDKHHFIIYLLYCRRVLEKEQTELRDTFVKLHKRGCL